MALQNEYTSSYGTLHDEAYIKINFIQVNCHKKIMNVALSTYGDKTARDTGKHGYEQRILEDVPCEPTSSINLVQQAYNQVKHYPEFTGSLDV
jgi:hypothetical protein